MTMDDLFSADQEPVHRVPSRAALVACRGAAHRRDAAVRDRRRAPARFRRHGVPRHGRGRHRPLPLWLGRGGMGPRLADRRRGDDQAEHVGELHLRHELVEREPPDHRRRPPGRRQGTRRRQRGPRRRRLPQGRPAADRSGGRAGRAHAASRSRAGRSASRRLSPSSPLASGGGRAGAVLDVDSVVDLTGAGADEALDWTAPDDGTWRLFTYWMHGTGQTASPSASVNYTVSYVDPDGAEAVIDYWDTVVLTPELREQIALNPRAQMYMDSLELFDLRRRRTVLGPHGRRGVPDPPRLRHRAVAAVPDPGRGDDGGRHHLPPRAVRGAPGHGREGPLRLRTHAHRPLHREHAAPVRGVPARQRDDAALGDQLRSAVRAHPAGPGGRRHRDRVAGVRRPRSTPTGCWPVRRTCSASSTPPRPARPPATTCSTTGSTTRSSPPSWPPASPRRCCTAGPAPPAPRASPSGPDTRACGRCSPSGSTPGSRLGVLPAVERRDGPLPVPPAPGKARASTSGSCAPTTSPTT